MAGTAQELQKTVMSSVLVRPDLLQRDYGCRGRCLGRSWLRQSQIQNRKSKIVLPPKKNLIKTEVNMANSTQHPEEQQPAASSQDETKQRKTKYRRWV
jgi:hypothetical protein